jgi:two-component system, chemotaxis family, sensor kinase Cph1
MMELLVNERMKVSQLIDECSREPIHIPGSIQGHGILLVLNARSLRVTHVSENATRWLNLDPASILGTSIEDIFDSEAAAQINASVRCALSGEASDFGCVALGGDGLMFDVITHCTEASIVVELELTAPERREATDESWMAVNRVLSLLKSAETVEELCQIAAREVRRLTSFGRVMIYQFDEEWNGAVIAEDLNGAMTSYLNLHFPASDIPEQARRLYALNKLRIIPEVDYEPSPIIAADEAHPPVDLSFSILRSVSPVHIEYLRNMGVRASMSISIMREDRLWGLVACHHPAPLHVSYSIRQVCSLVVELLGFLLASREQHEDAVRRDQVAHVRTRLFEALVRTDDYRRVLAEHEADVLGLVNATGAAILSERRIQLFGSTPEEKVVGRLAQALEEHSEEDLFSTARLAAQFPEHAGDPVAAGILSVSISRRGRQRIIWFRQELIEEVVWAGDPDKAVTRTNGDNGRPQLHPRNSFEKWRTQRRGQSRAWLKSEVQAAIALREMIIDVVLVRAERLAQLNVDLEEANILLSERNRELQEFTYIASHDLQEPLRKIRSFSSLLLDEYMEMLDKQGRFYLDRVGSSAERMSTLITDLLEYSRLVSEPDKSQVVSLNNVVRHVIRQLKLRLEEGGAEISVGELPDVQADERLMMRMFECILDNAVKFRDRDRKLVIEIEGQIEIDDSRGEQVSLVIRDNGMGFDGRYSKRIFHPFEQLEKISGEDGTGIGLALVRRIVEQHGGSVEASGERGKGATFEISLPRE